MMVRVYLMVDETSTKVWIGCILGPKEGNSVNFVTGMGALGRLVSPSAWIFIKVYCIRTRVVLF
jgi:hypothetical protein